MWLLSSKQNRPADAIMRIGGPDDWLTLGQCYSNIFIPGQVGSGKTTGPGANLILGLLAHPSRPGALVLCQKPDEAGRWMRYCQIDKRSADVIHVQLGGPHTINLLDYELAGPGGVEGAKASVDVLLEVANRNRPRNSSDHYWDDSTTRALGNAMVLIRMSKGKCGFGEVLEFMQSLPNSTEQLMDEEWKNGSFAVECVNAAAEKFRQTRPFQMAANWFVSEWPELSDKTRSVIHSVCINTLDKFLAGQFASLISAAQTTFTPEMALEQGKIIIFDVPGAVYGQAAVWASVAIKLLFQKAAMRRDLSKSCRPLILWADEAANFCVPEQDALFLSQSRQFKVICVNIVQNLPLVITALGGSEAARHQAEAWISNHATHIIAANTDPSTCKMYSEMAPETRETLYGGSTGGPFRYDIMADMMGQELSNASVSWNQTIRPSLPSAVFAQLAKGGREYGFITEAYVMQSGRTFSNGKPWIKAAWRQRL